MDGDKMLEYWHQGSSIMPVNDATIQAFAVGLVCVVLGAALVYMYRGNCLWYVKATEGTKEMGKPVNYTKPNVEFSKKEKEIILRMAEGYMEGELLKKNGKMKRPAVRKLYKKLGIACGIDELIPPGEVKARLLSLRKHLDLKKPVYIPGDPPIQDIKRVDLSPAKEAIAESKFKAFFKSKVTA